MQRESRSRVLILVELNAPSRYWEGAVQLLQAYGTKVVLITVRERGPLHRNLEAIGCHTDSLDCRTSLDYPKAILRLASLIGKHQIDIIHACEAIPSTIGGMAGVLAWRAKRIFHRQHTFAVGKQRLLTWVGSRLAHLTMAVSESTAQYANQLDRVPLSRIRVAYSGVAEPRRVSAEEVASLRRQLDIPEGAAVISSVARLSKEKGHVTLLEAVPLMVASLAQPPHLVFAGSGLEEDALKERARTVSPAVVHFAGQQQDIAPWFAIGDVVAVPSYHEAFGLSAAEAMACGRPLVASRVGGLAEVVEDEVTGILVNPQDPEALAGGILRMLQCPERARAMADAAYQRFREKFTMEAMVQGWIACYEEMGAMQKK